MKEIRGKLKGNNRKNKGSKRKIKETRGKIKETREKLESMFWKVVFSTKLPAHETSVS